MGPADDATSSSRPVGTKIGRTVEMLFFVSTLAAATGAAKAADCLSLRTLATCRRQRWVVTLSHTRPGKPVGHSGGIRHSIVHAPAKALPSAVHCELDTAARLCGAPTFRQLPPR